RAQPDPVQFVFCGNTNQVQVQGKRKRNCLLSSNSFSLPCGGLSGVYGGSDQSRDEENFRSSTKKGIVTTTKLAR
ncbi:hypothetical protein A2U01_0029267, partial [Trifolium medium]|nr:hypothetical protein [Trifolium medium]